MSDFARDRLDLDDEDRLPWLEPASDFDDEVVVSPFRLILVVLAGLSLLALVSAGVYALLDRDGAGSGGGAGKLITAQPGDYKIPASEADAKKFAGEGDASFAASEGMEREGRIDPSRLPETPVAGAGKADAPVKGVAAAKPEAKVTARVATVSGAGSARTGEAKSAASGGAGVVQLGAYGNTALAKDAWGKLSKRFSYLEGLSASVEPVNVGGTTLYRLRTSTGSTSSASALCGRLKVAGESCMVVN